MSAMLRVVRCKTRPPMVSSSRVMARLTDDLGTRMRCAAFEKLPAFTTATNTPTHTRPTLTSSLWLAALRM